MSEKVAKMQMNFVLMPKNIAQMLMTIGQSTKQI
jgi:hypothetical protein